MAIILNQHRSRALGSGCVDFDVLQKMKTALLLFIVTGHAFADEKIKMEPRAILDFFYPKTIGVRSGLGDVVDADVTRRFYEGWSKQTYLIRDTVVITGDQALALFAAIKSGTSDNDATTGWSGHDPRYGVTLFFNSDKTLVTTFCFQSDSWIRRDNGQFIRSEITKPKDLEKLLRGLDPKHAEQDGTGQSATRPESKSEGSDKPQPESEGLSQ
ncbi:MAG: hypothetical protein EAZ84_06775 [Verrucomicrobia bacterium]|nr:MAG: hypothetical protein EAZ84_06775 [Verrucomicrobiota bacterium]TAE87729.1 MAG: hypothetical protein EAZ82_07160 [Verrucomicrobiota bacterium]